ncbi:hypothetical protein [Paenibacillus lutrae]|uniref:Uncharacterized protein n=1 Tax=Paenibacillus lutrae TaxID=2078573 RepID=A0A7X3FJN6_9BACL|nr:hypothetical protein [Paenibacillus lutrae]MVP00557.1 hypothetical protein [Paenibacillus lutrae]
MKNRRLLITCVLTLGIMGSGYYIADQRVIGEETGAVYNHEVYEDVDKLISDVSLVVEVIPTSTNKEIVKEKEYVDSYTLTDVKVNKVLKNSTDKAEVPQILPVIERFFTVDNGIKPGRTKIIADEYTPLIPGNRYILFLNWSEEKQAYWIHALNQGKINMDGHDEKEKNEAARNERFKNLQESAFSKFK